jgi:AraC-like DNA-binding protein
MATSLTENHPPPSVELFFDPNSQTRVSQFELSSSKHNLFDLPPSGDSLLEIYLSLTGTAQLHIDSEITNIAPLTVIFHPLHRHQQRSFRPLESPQLFLLISMPLTRAQNLLSGDPLALHPDIRNFLANHPDANHKPVVQVMQTRHIELCRVLRKPTVPPDAHSLWYRAKVSELMSELMFLPQKELFCERQKRISRERVAEASRILREQYSSPPKLNDLAVQVGCNAFYLSRIFSEEMGISIPQYLRQIRIERAAQLLRSGEFNVTEAALEVGYNSLSHFSKAFTEVVGCSPGSYPKNGR